MTSILNRYSNLKQRIISALVTGPIVITAIYWNEWSYFIVFFIIAMLSMLEFYRLAALAGVMPLKGWGTFNGLLIYSLVFMSEKELIPVKYLYTLPLTIACTYLIKLYKKNEPQPFTSIASTFLGIIYIGLPFAMLHLIAFSKGFYSYELVIGFLLILWANDTGAYFVGLSVGKTKLFEHVSPKKSWEGSIGGGVTALVVSYGISYYFKILDRGEWMAIAMIMVVAGTYGDLVESLFKRSVTIKDSGNSIPGHGGVLDRFDSFLIAIPFILALIKLFF